MTLERRHSAFGRSLLVASGGHGEWAGAGIHAMCGEAAVILVHPGSIHAAGSSYWTVVGRAARYVRPVSDGWEERNERWHKRFSAMLGLYLDDDAVAPAAGAAAFAGVIDTEFVGWGPGEYDIEGQLWVAWQVVTDATDTPDDRRRGRLADLIVALRDRGLPAAGPGQAYLAWKKPTTAGEWPPIFGPHMRETWNFSPPHMPAGAWTHLNAFVAQLTTRGIDFSLYAIWALRDALEDDEHEAGLPAVLPGAVEWFRLAGSLLASLTRQREAGYHGRSAIIGARAQRAGLTEPGFNPARWDFWRTRLAEIAASGGQASPVAQRGLDYLLAAG